MHIGNLRDNANYLMPEHYSLGQQQALTDALILVMLVMAGIQYYNRSKYEAAALAQ
jgi:hypothetical protein